MGSGQQAISKSEVTSMVGARPCPVCGRGMYRRKDLLEHIKRMHGWYFKQFIEPKGKGGGGGSKKKREK